MHIDAEMIWMTELLGMSNRVAALTYFKAYFTYASKGATIKLQ